MHCSLQGRAQHKLQSCCQRSYLNMQLPSPVMLCFLKAVGRTPLLKLPLLVTLLLLLLVLLLLLAARTSTRSGCCGYGAAAVCCLYSLCCCWLLCPTKENTGDERTERLCDIEGSKAWLRPEATSCPALAAVCMVVVQPRQLVGYLWKAETRTSHPQEYQTSKFQALETQPMSQDAPQSTLIDGSIPASASGPLGGLSH